MFQILFQCTLKIYLEKTTVLTKLKRIQIIQTLFSNYKGIKLEVNSKDIWIIYHYLEMKEKHF